MTFAVIRQRLRAVLLATILVSPGCAMAQAAWPSELAPGAYVLDQRRANLTVRLNILGAYAYATRFTRLDGSFTFDPARLGSAQVTINVDPRSMVDQASIVGRRMLAILDPDRFPTITFVSRELRFTDGRPALLGSLTMHGVTRPVTLGMAFHGATPESPGAAVRTRFSGTGRIRRSDFGMATLHGLAGDQIDLAFQVEFVRR